MPSERAVTTGELNQWVQDLTCALSDRDAYLREHTTVVQSVTGDGPCEAHLVPLIEFERESQDRLYALRGWLRERLYAGLERPQR